MADDIKSDIIINIDTSVGIAEIKNLQRSISQLNAQLLKAGTQQAQSAQIIQRNLLNNINATGKFAANVRTISTTAESFTSALERNKLGMGEYFRYAGASTKTFGRLFRSEFATIEKVTRERVKTLQTQFVKLGRDGSGAMKAIAVRPLALDMDNLATKTAIAAQKQQLFNQLVKQGSTNLLNFGKNTQWAGRQLMVGFTIPLAMMGSVAAKTFMAMEEQAIKFRRVYGDSFTATEETEKMINQIQRLASEFTKYGVAAEKTMEMAATAAAMGLQNADLLAQVNQATRLSVLGGVEQEQALETTISLMSAFGTSAEDLAGKIDFLNAVENQTVTAIEDLTIAIPKAGPVVQQLGGNVQDLAFFLTAMKEGGINASEGANALKSGLASLINPSEKSALFLKNLGININSIVEGNAGDVKGVVVDFAQALDTLDPLNRARAIEQLFGKFQFSRLSTLFQNVVKEGSQASRVLQLTRSTSEELAILSERELKRVEDSPMYKFQKAVEDIKVSLVPLGEAFLKAITPVIEFAKGLLDQFNQMGDGAKNFAVLATTVIAGIGPVLLMTFGLVANGVANLIKMFAFMGNMFRNAGRSSGDLATSTEYLTQQQLEASAVAASLDQSHAKLIQTFNVESAAVDKLAQSYAKAILAQSKLLNIPIGPRNPGGQKPLKLNSGIVSVPGPKGAGDIVPAMLSPGEAVIPAKQSQKYAGIIQGMINDEIPGYSIGRNPFSFLLKNSRVSTRMKGDDLRSMLRSGDTRYKSAFETGTGDDYINNITGQRKTNQEFLRRDMETDVLGLPRDMDSRMRPTYGSVEMTPFGRMLSGLFGLRGRQFRTVTSPGNEHLERYGDVDLVGKRRLNKRSSILAGDALKQYAGSQAHYGMRRRKGEAGSFLPPMVGASPEQLDKSGRFWQFNSPFGQSIPSGGNGFISNPGVPYIEAQVAGGFNLKEISKIRVSSRSEAKELQKLVDQAGLKIRVTPRNAPMAIRALSNLFGTRFSQGTTSMSFNQDMSLQASHLTPAALNDDGTENFTKKQAIARITREYQNGVKSGLLTDSPKMRANLKNAVDNISKSTAKTFKLYGNSTGLMTTSLNQAWANKSATISSATALERLKLQPAGMLTGSQLLSMRDIASGLDLPDYNARNSSIASYSTSVDNELRRRLSSLGNSQITEDQFHRLYSESADDVLKRMPKGADKTAIGRLRALSALNISAGFVSPGTESGPTRPANMSILRKKMQAVAINQRGPLKDIMGPAYLDEMLSRTKIQGISRDLKEAFQEKISKMTKAQEKKFYEQIIAAGGNTSKLRELAGLDQAKIKTSSKAKTKQPVEVEPTQSSGGAKTAIATKKIKAKPKEEYDISQFYTSRRKRLYANSGVVSVPGPKGAGDIVPAMLSPGEAVIPAEMSEKYSSLINSMISGNVPGYNKGRKARGKRGFNFGDKYQADPAIVLPPRPDGTPQTTASVTPPQITVSEKSSRIAGEVFSKMALGARAVGRLGLRFGDAAVNGMVKASQAKQQRISDAAMEASGLRRNKNGAMIDAQTGRFASADQKAELERLKNDKEFRREINAERRAEVKERRQVRADRIGRISGPAGGVAGGLAMGAMMVGMGEGPMAEAANAAMPALFGLSAILPMLPMLASPIGLTVGAIAALVGGFFLLQNHINGVRKEAAELAGKLSSGQESMQSFAEFAGNVSASEFAQRRRQSDMTPFTVTPGKTTFGQAFVQTDAGKAKIADVQELIGKVGRDETIRRVQDQLLMAITTKALSADQARSVAQSIGQQLEDYNFSTQVNAKINQIFGPDGKPLVGNTIKIYTDVITNSTTGLTGDSGILEDEDLTGRGIVPFFDVDRVSAKEGEAAAFIKSFYQESQMAIDSLDAEMLPLIDNLVAEGKFDEALKKEDEYLRRRKDLILLREQEIQKIRDSFFKVAPVKQQAIINQLRDQVNTQFEGDAKTQSAVNKISEGNNTLKNVVRLDIIGEVSAGNISTSTIQTLVDQFDPKNAKNNRVWDAVARISTQVGPGAVDQLNLITQAMDETKRADFIANFETEDPQKAKEMMDSLALIARYDGVGGFDVEATLAYYTENPEALAEFQKKQKQLEKMEKEGKLTIKNVIDQELVTDPAAVEELKSNSEYFKKLPEEQKVTYLTTYISKLEAVAESEVAAWRAANPQFQQYYTDDEVAAKIAEKTAQQYTDANAADTTKGGGDGNEDPADTTKKEDPFTGLLERLKMVRKESINTAGGLNEIMKILGGKKTLTQFNGLSQALARAKASPEFVEFVNSLDKSVQKQLYKKNAKGIMELTQRGKALQKAFNEASIGEYQDSLRQTVADSNNQVKAFNKLISGGMTYEQALGAVADATLAAAIASKDFGTKELKTMVAEAKRAEAALNRIAAIERRSEIRKDMEADLGRQARVSRFGTNNTQFNEMQQFAIEEDPGLLKDYEDSLAGIRQLPKNFGERLNQIIRSPEFKQRFFDNAFNMAMDAFSILEEEIRLDFELGLDDTGLNKAKVNLSEIRKLIADDEKKIADLNFIIDDLDAGLQRMSVEEDKINESYDKRFEALDKIEKANDAISRQQKSQLTLADALSQGDIAAAARAAQEMRADSASGSIQSQREMLERTRDSQLLGLKTSIKGELLTREEIEKRIKGTQQEIFDIEEKTLEVNQKAIADAEFKIGQAVRNLEVAEKTRAEWEKEKNAIEAARVSTTNYNEVLTAALGMVEGIIGYWNDLDGRTVKTTHEITTVHIDVDNPANSPEAQVAALNEEFAKLEDKSGTHLDPTLNANQSRIDQLNREIQISRWRVRNDKKLTKSQIENLMQMNMERIAEVKKLGGTPDMSGEINPNMGGGGGTPLQFLAGGGKVKYYPMGGLIPYKSGGGSIFKPLGTDTVPAMLSPGEFVVRKYAVDNFGTDNLKAINSGTYKGDSMYNYEVNVSVQTDANPDQIARAVMGQIKQIDAQRIRGNRF